MTGTWIDSAVVAPGTVADPWEVTDMDFCVARGGGTTRCRNEVESGTDYCGRHGRWFDADLEVFHEVSEHFRMDVREYWARSNFYLLVEGALVSVFVAVARDSTSDRGLATILGVFGFLFCLYWGIVAREGVMWIERWRKERIRLDARIDRTASLGGVEGMKDPLKSAENATSFAPFVFAVGWVALLVWLWLSNGV